MEGGGVIEGRGLEDVWVWGGLGGVGFFLACGGGGGVGGGGWWLVGGMIAGYGPRRRMRLDRGSQNVQPRGIKLYKYCIMAYLAMSWFTKDLCFFYIYCAVWYN